MRVGAPVRIGGSEGAYSSPWRKAFAAIGLIASLALPTCAAAGDDIGGPQTETWIGGEATRNVWSIYSGLTWAPFGSVREDGLRVRLAGGYGQYRYDTTIDGAASTVHGQGSFTDLMAGYQLKAGDLTLKAFAGASLDAHLLTPNDPGNRVNDIAWGPKAAVETWLDLGRLDWVSLDGSWTSAHQTYWSRLRLGHRVLDAVSVGVEGGLLGNEAAKNARGGGFVRYEWESGEISASGGVTGDIARPSNPYATLVYLSRF